MSYEKLLERIKEEELRTEQLRQNVLKKELERIDLQMKLDQVNTQLHQKSFELHNAREDVKTEAYNRALGYEKEHLQMLREIVKGKKDI